MEENEVIKEGQEETTEGQETVGTPQIDPEIEERAKLYGHVPKEKFKGDPEKWVPADVFVERAEELLPIARSMNRKLEKDLTHTKTELSELRKTMKAVIKTHEKIAKNTYDSKLSQLKKDQAVAVSEGDLEKWQELEDTREKLEAPETIEFKETTPNANDDVVVAQWKKENSWYESDPDMGIYADSISTFISTRNPGLPVDDFLSKVKAEVKKRFPDKFENPNRSKTAVVDRTSTTGGGDTKAGGKTYSDLPQDAKRACDEFVKNKVTTREQYVKTYFEEE